MNKGLKALYELKELLTREMDGVNFMKQIESIEKELISYNLIVNKEVDVWLLKCCDYNNYVRIRKQSEIDSNVYCDDGAIVNNQLTKEEFDFLSEEIFES